MRTKSRSKRRNQGLDSFMTNSNPTGKMNESESESLEVFNSDTGQSEIVRVERIDRDRKNDLSESEIQENYVKEIQTIKTKKDLEVLANKIDQSKEINSNRKFILSGYVRSRRVEIFRENKAKREAEREKPKESNVAELPKQFQDIAELEKGEKYYLYDIERAGGSRFEFYRVFTTPRTPNEAYEFYKKKYPYEMKSKTIKIIPAKDLNDVRQKLSERNTVFVRFKPNSDFWSGKRVKDSDFDKFKSKYGSGRLRFKWNKAESAYLGKVKKTKVEEFKKTFADTGEIKVTEQVTQDKKAISVHKEKLIKQAERLERFAEKNKQESEMRLQKSREISSMIPMGQPILVDHHSAGKHRKALKDIDFNRKKSIEKSSLASKQKTKAKRLRDKAESL